MKKRNKNKNIIKTILAVLFIAYGVYISEISNSFGMVTNSDDSNEIDTNLVVSFLDVGQADSILIQNDNENMLIDAGNNEDGELLVQYFQSLGIKNFKYLVGTHPHEDHIGGLDNIIKNFDIKNVYLPDVITTTTTFVEVLNALDEKKQTYTVPLIDEILTLGQAKIQVLYTGNDEKDLNNSSIVLKLTFGNNRFLFTGDATETVEEQILDKDLAADVLKVGHHGSKYSTSDLFLEKINPKYAIISVGRNNSYHHPDAVTLSKLSKQNIEVHQTAQEGTIIITSDGKNLHLATKKTNTNGGSQ